jgi:membrane protein DedA with SNARE-associated domain
MFDWLVQTFTEHPYLGTAIMFLACGFGLPLPEEIILVAGGFVSFKGYADHRLMILSCAGAILLGDFAPFLLGRVFGPRVLRIRPLRVIVNRRRLAMFDLWFRRRGDLVIFIARFVPGLRVVAYFTAGTMRMPWFRFLALDLAGIALACPLLVWIGYHFGSVIDLAIQRVQQVERGILLAALAAILAFALWYGLRRRRRTRALLEGPSETYIEPSLPAAADAVAASAVPGDAQEPAEGEPLPDDGAASPHGESRAGHH